MVRCAKAEPVERAGQCRLPLDSGRKRVEHIGLAYSDWLRLWWDSAVFVAVVSNKEHSPLQQQPVAALSSLFHISVCD